MTDLTPFWNQLQTALTDSLPTEAQARVIPLALVSLIGGIGLSVLGAKLAKPGFGVVFAVLGGVAGVSFGREAGYSVPACAAVGAALFTTIALLTFRMWVGVATGLVLCAAALGGFGYQRVAPHASEFGGAQSLVSMEGARARGPQFEADAGKFARPGEWVEQFWGYVKEKDSRVATEGRLIGLAALVGGLFLGVVLVRWMLILSTSCIGTALVVSGVVTALMRLVPDSHQALQRNPTVMGMAVGGFLVTSLIVQTLLTRKAPGGGETASAKKSG